MEITADIVRELLHYKPDTGIFTWKPRDKKWFRDNRTHRMWNTRYSGKLAGNEWVCRSGVHYTQIGVFGVTNYAHRLAFISMTGEWPDGEVDHINRDGRDNRWSNLRVVTSAENKRNLSRARNNTSGFTGVAWVEGLGSWKAQIKIGGKAKHLGLFDTVVDAVAARMRANQEHRFYDGHGQDRPY